MSERQSETGRVAQRSRTRKAIVKAAARLLEKGERPSFDDVVLEAEVSRATAYRYFPGLDALLSEAAVDALVPDPEVLFDVNSPQDAFERLAMVDETFDRACRQREVALRLMMARSLERSVQPDNDMPLRQNRRVPMIESALAPVSGKVDPESLRNLTHALAMVIGTEGLIALKDVVGLDDSQSRTVRRWAIDALLGATLRLD